MIRPKYGALYGAICVLPFLPSRAVRAAAVPASPASQPASDAPAAPTTSQAPAPVVAPIVVPPPAAAPALQGPATAPALIAPIGSPTLAPPASAPAYVPLSRPPAGSFDITRPGAMPDRNAARQSEIPGTTAPAANTDGGPAIGSTATEPAIGSAEPATQAAGPADQESLGTKLVTANLDLTRDAIAPGLGAVQYTVGPAQIQDVPGGSAAPFQQVLLRAPGVVQDSFGQEHIRGEHGNLTYRVNGVLLPQPVNVFGQEIDTRIAQSVTLIDGSLPAQYGFHTAGIVDITTKSGATLNHNELSVYGGSYDTIQPSLQVGGSDGKLDYFVTASGDHNGLGIENTTSSHVALHDYTDQERLFTYLSYNIDDTSRVSLFLNAYNGQFQIPATHGLPQPFTLAGHPAADSGVTGENQNEQEYYTVVAYQKTVNNLSYQISGFARYGQITFRPDYVNDPVFQGVAGAVYNNYVTYGAELDASYILDTQHTLRGGLVADYTSEKLNVTNAVFSTNPDGSQASSSLLYIGDDSGNVATESGVYLQDEWKILPAVTLNYGLRYDHFDSNFDREGQLSPRVNAVWKIDDLTTAHAGYSRYFVPPPVQNLSFSSVSKFNGTTNAPLTQEATPSRVERSNYYDVGLSRLVTPQLQINVDGFYKQSRQLVDLGQFGNAIIFEPFNYKSGTVYGAEFSSVYKQGDFSGFANFAWVKTMAHDIDSQQFRFDPAELQYIHDHNIFLDHDSTYTLSAGAAYTFLKDNRVYLDMLYGSGLRSGFANTRQEPQHYPVNVGYEHVFHGGFWGPNNVRARIDVVNLFDQGYQLRQGGGLGVNADQWGQRRSFYGGLTYEF